MTSLIKSEFVKALMVLAALGALAWGISRGVSAIDAAGYQRAEAIYQKQIADIRTAQATEVLRTEREQRARSEAQNRNMLRLSEQLITAKTTIDAQTKKLQERGHDVSTQYRPQPGAALQPVPDWIVTRGWVCDYNRAIGYATAGAATAVGGDAAAACAADAFSPSYVSAERILIHHEEYGGYCRKLEQQVNVLLDHLEFLESGAAGK